MNRLWLGLGLILLAGCAPTLQSESPIVSAAGDEAPPAIFGGRPVEPSDDIAASVVAIRFKMTDGDSPAICTGTLISPRIVLTAAHCAIAGPFHTRVYFGTDLSEVVLDEFEARGERVTSMQIHPNYRSRATDIQNRRAWSEANPFDIAIITLEAPAPKGTRPLPIKRYVEPSRLGDSKKLTLAGFGATDFNALSGQEQSEYRLQSVRIAPLKQPSRAVMVFDQTRDKGVCRGDSGGPALVELNDGGLAVVAVGISARNPQDPVNVCHGQSRFTRLEVATRWLKSVAPMAEFL